jgi:SPP1 family phage portal protein
LSTEINLLYQRLKADSEITDEAIIKNLIRFHEDGAEREMRINGINYYDSENSKIKERKKKELYTNHKMANGFYKKIIDQKVSYCVGNEVVIENLPENDSIPDINDFLEEFCTESSKKGLEWLYLYLDKAGEIKSKIIGSEECIPIYDTEYQDTLILLIRYYKMEMVDNKKTYYRNKVELYDSEKISYYIQDEDYNYHFDTHLVSNPVYYNVGRKVQMGEIKEEKVHGWGVVPFLPLKNTNHEVYDLQNIKSHIDMYDVIESDFANNIEQFQDAILVVVNRGAQDWEVFWEELKDKKIITIDAVSEIGGASYLKIDIPVEARKEFLKILRENIFEFGMAVDTTRVGDGNLTNVVIKSRYADLDLKANKFLKQVKKFLKEYYEFLNLVFKLKNLPQINVKTLNYVFNKKMIFNETELIENFVNQEGKISNETLLSTHPHVDDVEEELERVELEVTQYQDEKTENEEGGEE